MGQLDNILVSLPAYQTPILVLLSGEEADTDGFWTPGKRRRPPRIAVSPLENLAVPKLSVELGFRTWRASQSS